MVVKSQNIDGGLGTWKAREHGALLRTNANSEATMIDRRPVREQIIEMQLQQCERMAKGLDGKMLFRVDEARELLGIGRTTFYKMVKADKLHVLRYLGRTVVKRSELERLTREMMTREEFDALCRDLQEPGR